MSLIPCLDPCVYQWDGYCSLSRASSGGCPGGRGCVNFVPLASAEPSGLQQGSQCLPDVGHPNQL